MLTKFKKNQNVVDVRRITFRWNEQVLRVVDTSPVNAVQKSLTTVYCDSLNNFQNA